MPVDLPVVVDTIVVHAARLPVAASQAAFSTVVIGAEQLRERQRLDQALTETPGVSLFRRNDSLAANPTTQGISLRSIAPSGAGRALVTLDGVPQNDPFGGWVIWASLPTEDVERVAIVRGGGAGPYGAGALTGVIALDERSSDGAALDVRTGSFGTVRGDFAGEGEFAGANVLVSLAGGRSDGYLPVRAGSGSVDQKLAEADWSAALRVTAEALGGNLSGRISVYDEDRGSGVASASARARGQAASLTLAAAPTASRLGYRLQGWVRTSDLFNSSASIIDPARTIARLTNVQYRTPSTGAGVNAALRGGGPAPEWEVGADLRYATGETRERLYTTGVATGSRIAGGQTVTGGVYGEMTRRYGPWLFTRGARADYWSTSDARRRDSSLATGLPLAATPAPAPDADGVKPSVRAGVRRSVGDGFVRAAAYTAFRPPTLNELHRPFNVGAVRTESNGALKPETLTGVEVGAGFERPFGSASATVFFNRIEDAITNVTLTPTLRQRQNAGTIEATGVEAEAAWTPSPVFSLRAAADYTDATTSTGLRPAQAPAFTATARMSWTPEPPVELSVRARYEGARFEDDLNTTRLAASTVIDGRASWRVTRTAEVYLAVDNAFDEAVETGVSFGLANYAAPRSISIGARFRR